jgi:hypothetical protein
MQGNLIRRPPTPEPILEEETDDEDDQVTRFRPEAQSAGWLSDKVTNVAATVTRSPSHLVTLSSSSPTEDPQAQTLWRQVLSELALSMPSATFNTWVRDTVGLAYTGER